MFGVSLRGLASNRHFQIFRRSTCAVEGVVVALAGFKDTRIFRPEPSALMAPGWATMSCLQKLPNAKAKRDKISGLER